MVLSGCGKDSIWLGENVKAEYTQPVLPDDNYILLDAMLEDMPEATFEDMPEATYEEIPENSDEETSEATDEELPKNR